MDIKDAALTCFSSCLPSPVSTIYDV